VKGILADRRSTGSRRPDPGRLTWRLYGALLAAALAAAVAYLALGFAPRERARAVDRWRAQLSAMADDRRAAIDRWLLEGLSHAQTLSAYPSVRRLAARGTTSPGEDTRPHIREVLSSVVGNADYRSAAVLDAEGRLLVKWGAALPDESTCLLLARRAMETDRPLAELHRHGDATPLVQFVAPIRNEANGPRTGVVLLTADPEAWLYPFLRHRPLASQTEETLLVRRDGDSALFLSPLRRRSDPPLSLRVPLAASLAASTALRGSEEFGEFVDYHGDVVLAATRKLQNAPWGLVAKVDRGEALAEVGPSVWLAALALVGLLTGLASAFAGAWLAHEARSRARLASTEARFSVLLDQASDAILLVGADGAIRDANQRTVDLYGYTREELRRLHVSELRHDKSRDEVEERSAGIQAQGEQVWQTVHVTRDGRELPVEVAARAVEIDGEQLHVSIVRDVAERRRVEQALRASEARYRSLFEANQDAVVLAVVGGHIVDANPAAVAMFGWSLEEFRRCTRNEMLDLHDPRLPPALEERARTGRFTGFLRFKRGDGTTFEGELSSVLIPAQGGPALATLVVRDVTERQRTQEAVQASEARFRALFSNMLEGFAYCRMVFEEGVPADLVYLDVNEAFGTLTGLRNVVGRRMTEVIPGIRSTNAELLEAYGRVVRTGEAEHFETFVPPLGIWLSISAYRPEPGHFVAVFENVTERKKSEQALRDGVARLSLALEAGRSGVWEWDLRTNENFWSEELWRLYGLEPWSAAPSYEAWRETILPEDREAAERAVADAARTGTELRAEWRVRYADGTEHWLASRGRPVRGPDGELVRFHGIVLDITDRRRAEEEIRRLNADLERRVASRTAELGRKNEDLRTEVEGRARAQAAIERYAREVEDLYNRAPCGYHSLDTEGRFVAVNDTELEWLGYSREELLDGRRITDILTPASRETFSANFAGFMERGHVHDLELEMVRKDGSTLWALVSATAVKDEAGAYLRSRSTLFDVTELVRARAQVAERTAALEAANRELESFAYSVSHDLRAPLRAVNGFSLLLARDYASHLDAEALRLLERVRANAQRMDQLISDLLAFSRAGRSEMHDRPVAMTALVGGVVSDLTAGVEGKRLEIEVQPLPDAVGDSPMLRQVWVNLLSNALKFTGPRERPRILVTGQHEDGEVVYRVQDNGVGFDMRHAGKLFGVFHRLHSAQEFAGTGAGLAIVQRIVQRHGGRVWADARVDEGATFAFTLPDRGDGPRGAAASIG
jgi:PAS domain S-box-containing protein